MKKLLTLLLALCMVFALCACGGNTAETETAAASDDVYTVSIQFSFPEDSADGAKAVMEAITEESGGRIQFDVYYSYSFVDAGDVIDALETNQLDIAGFMPSEHPAEMPLNGAMMSLPLLNFPSWAGASQIYLNLLYNSEDMLAEFTDNGMIFWAGYMCPGYQIYSTKEITDLTPSLFNGLTVMCDQAEMQTFINSNKGGAISVFPTDYLSNLQNGVADTLVQHVNCAYVFGTYDYVKTAVFFGEGGFYNLPLTYAFSETFWNELPADLQQIFANHAADMCYQSQMSDEGLYYNVAYPALAESANIITLNDEQIAAWQSAIAPTVEAAMDSIAGDNANAPAILAQLKDMIASYDADTFTIGTNNFGLEATWGASLADTVAAPAAEEAVTEEAAPAADASGEPTAEASGEATGEPSNEAVKPAA